MKNNGRQKTTTLEKYFSEETRLLGQLSDTPTFDTNNCITAKLNVGKRNGKL